MDSSLILEVVCYELAILSNANRKKSATAVIIRPAKQKNKPVNKENQNPVHSRP
jgi:rRNA-processing protein FCF1